MGTSETPTTTSLELHSTVNGEKRLWFRIDTSPLATADLRGFHFTFGGRRDNPLICALLAATELAGCKWDVSTIWPVGFNPEGRGMIFIHSDGTEVVDGQVGEQPVCMELGPISLDEEISFALALKERCERKKDNDCS